MKNFITTHNLSIQNKGGNFNNRAGAETNIDITLTTRNLNRKIINWKVLDGSTCSDHNTIKVEIEMEGRTVQNIVPEEGNLNYNPEGINWEVFESNLALPKITTNVDLDGLTNELEKITTKH